MLFKSIYSISTTPLQSISYFLYPRRLITRFLFILKIKKARLKAGLFKTMAITMSRNMNHLPAYPIRAHQYWIRVSYHYHPANLPQ